MKTVTRAFYVDLWPGWQDGDFVPCLFSHPPRHPVPEGNRRFRIEVPLPAFGGSAEAEEFKSEAPTVREEMK